MRKFFAVLLTVCMLSALLVVPAYAAEPISFDYWLDLSSANVISQTVSKEAYAVAGESVTTADAYPLDNLFDGNVKSTAVLNLLGKATRWDAGSAKTAADVFLSTDLVIDLGDYYNIKDFKVTFPTSTQNGAVAATYGERVNPQTTEGTYSTVTFHTVNPVENSSDAGVKITPYARWSVGMNLSALDANTKYRYIKIAGPWTSRGAFVNEISVKVGAKESGVRYTDLLYNNNYDYKNLRQYPMSNILDGNPDTHAAISTRNGTDTGIGFRVIDLGETKTLNSIKVDVPSNIKELFTQAGITSSMNNANGKIYVSETCPEVTSYAESPETVDPNLTRVYSGWLYQDKNITFSEPTDVRYITILAPMATYPVIISELELDEYVAPPASVSFASDVAFGDANGVETLRFYFTPTYENATVTDFGAYIVPFALFDEEGESALVSGSKEIESGKTFAADLVGIPVAAYDSTIVATPFIFANGQYFYGDAVNTTVNAVK